MWNKENSKRPILIAGPCSAESKQQVLATAEKLQSLNLSYFRAGIWKPRTRPGDFEGVGSIGLQWLKEVKATYNIPVCVEVANQKHIEECLEAGIDAFWIGARTTTNPFSVQAIADALKGVDIPVMVKNPINPDLKLWIGAIERIKKAGIKKVAAIHRGFSIYEKIDYRNLPQWQITIDLQNECPDLPLLCDPSHIGGKRKYIHEISQKAMDLNFDGLMIETHHNPTEAWTDAKQQVSPDELTTIMQQLIIRETQVQESSQKDLQDFRQEIDQIDNELIQILKKRMEFSQKIGEYKKQNGLIVLQNYIWSELLKKNVAKATAEKMSQRFATALFKEIHLESINIQEKVLSKKS